VTIPSPTKEEAEEAQLPLDDQPLPSALKKRGVAASARKSGRLSARDVNTPRKSAGKLRANGGAAPRADSYDDVFTY